MNIASYADESTPYVSANNMNVVDKSLEEEIFSDNLMKSNASRCHLLVSTINTINIRVESFDKKETLRS